MLAYIAILSATLAGYAGAPVWTISVAAIALAALSYARHWQLYRQGSTLGLDGLVESTLLQSLLNALIASSVAYGGGLAFRMIGV